MVGKARSATEPLSPFPSAAPSSLFSSLSSSPPAFSPSSSPSSPLSEEQIAAALQLEKQEEARVRVVDELWETEGQYVADLEVMVNVRTYLRRPRFPRFLSSIYPFAPVLLPFCFHSFLDLSLLFCRRMLHTCFA